MQARGKANTLPLRLPRSSGASHLPCPQVVAVSFRCCRSEADESGSEALVWPWSAPAAVADGLREIFSNLRQNKTKKEDLTEKYRREPGNSGRVSVRQGQQYDRANGAEGGDRENAVGNAKRFEFDRAVAFVLVFRTRAY